MISYLKTYNWINALRGMRNPLESWYKNDSVVEYFPDIGEVPEIGENDLVLAKKLIKAGASHRKFLRQILISFDLEATLKFFDQFSTYLHTVSNSTSLMHMAGNRFFYAGDFIFIDKEQLDDLNEKIIVWKALRSYNMPDRLINEAWEDMIYSIPNSILYRRTITINYEVFLSIYAGRKDHKLREWRCFCKSMRDFLPYMDEFIKVLEG